MYASFLVAHPPARPHAPSLPFCVFVALCAKVSSRDLLRRQHSDAEQKEKPYSHGLEQVRKTVRELRAAGRSIMMKDNPLARSTALQKRAVQLMHSLERKAPKRLRIGNVAHLLVLMACRRVLLFRGAIQYRCRPRPICPHRTCHCRSSTYPESQRPDHPAGPTLVRALRPRMLAQPLQRQQKARALRQAMRPRPDSSESFDWVGIRSRLIHREAAQNFIDCFCTLSPCLAHRQRFLLVQKCPLTPSWLWPL